MSRSQYGRHGVQRNWVRQVNHSEVRDGHQTLIHIYWTKSCNQACNTCYNTYGEN